MSQPEKPVSPADMIPSAGATQSLNFEPFQEVRAFLRAAVRYDAGCFFASCFFRQGACPACSL